MNRELRDYYNGELIREATAEEAAIADGWRTVGDTRMSSLVEIDDRDCYIVVYDDRDGD